MELFSKSASELSGLLKKKEITAVELCNDIFDRIEKTEDKVESFITLCRENAMEQAAASDKARICGEVPDLSGIPVAIKDNILTKDIKTTCASKMLSDFIPPYDATVCEKMKKAGMVIIGKTNLDEFAMGSYCDTSYFKKTKNPHDFSYMPGGSSGGSAACLAARQAPLAIASDTGGSIRQPASHCGVVGMKPTYGTVSRFGGVAFSSSFDQIGPMARNVSDTAMLLDVISGYDPKDSTSYKREAESFYKGLDESKIKDITIGIPKEYFGEGISAEVMKNIMAAADEFKKLGAKLSDISLPTASYVVPIYYIIASAEASSNLGRFDGIRYGFRSENFSDLADIYVKTRSEGFGDEVKRRIMMGTFVLSSGYYDAYYNKARIAMQKIKLEYKNAFNKCDIILTPVTPTGAVKFGEKPENVVEIYAGDICTASVNISGLPAISAPCGRDKNGMPVGMQLIGRHFGEQDILNAAYAYEKSCCADYTAKVKGADI